MDDPRKTTNHVSCRKGGSSLVRRLVRSEGDPAKQRAREWLSAMDDGKLLKFGLTTIEIHTLRGRFLRDRTTEFGSFNSDTFNEAHFERYLADDPRLAEPAYWYWIRKLKACVFAGNNSAAVAASLNVQRYFASSPSRFLVLDPIETAEYHFYGALAQAAAWDAAVPDQRQQHQEALAAHHERLVLCAADCPENFEDRTALVGAEIARIEGRTLDAEQLYEQAIHSAHDNGFTQNEGLANELAARFYATRNFQKIAQAYLRDARYCYLCWGADGKVRELDQLHPRLRQDGPLLGPTGAIAAPVEQLDLATVIKVSQAVSGEIVSESLIDTLMRTAIEHAGAERGLLLLPLGDDLQIEAEATTIGGTVVVRQVPPAAIGPPASIVHYVMRTREILVLDDASAKTGFSDDAYVLQYHARSILCVPLIKQARLIGVLYLENNLAPNAFTPARVAVLKLVASEAAISLENTRLYGELREREAKIRRLVDANIVGIFMWKFEGQIFEANDAFLRTVGWDQADLAAGRLRWTDLTPPEWRKHHERAWFRTIGTIQPYEKEYFRKDGSRVPVLVGAALFDDSLDEGVAFVIDLTERKRAEEALRESERRYNEAQIALAHANRLTTIGQLTASIAHEVKQPIAATVMNASAGLRWLANQPPRLDEVRQSLARIMEDGSRASDFVVRIHALINKSTPRREPFDINDTILEIVALTRSEMVKHGVTSQIALSNGLPLVLGDRIQMQQVILNLVTNAVQAMSGIAEGARELRIDTMAVEPGRVLVAVGDSGPGLPPVNFDRLFEAFFSTKADGLGMGLSICRSIIEAHHGRLWAAPNTPQGAVFQFTLPAPQSV